MKKPQKTVSIIGAGMAGLAAARALILAGHRVIIYEKSKGLGGRMATRYLEGCTFDHGAQILKPEGSSLDSLMRWELPHSELVEVTQPILPYASDGSLLPIDPSRDGEKKYSYERGVTTLPKLLVRSFPADQFSIYFEVKIGRFEESETGISLFDSEGRKMSESDFVILTAPAPQAADLIEKSATLDPVAQAEQVAALRSVTYRPCLSVLLGYSNQLIEENAYSLIAEDRSTPLLWLAFEHLKSPHRAPKGEFLLIAQFGGDFSRDHYDDQDSDILSATYAGLSALLPPEAQSPLFSQVKRWRFSQPVGMIEFNTVNSKTSRLIVAGDALRPGNGRVHEAYESGLEAAERAML